MNGLQSRVPWDAYVALPGVRVSSLKAMQRSAKHYQDAITNTKETAALRLGTAAHCAVLEPERFESAFAIWDRRTESGRLAPRNGKAWDAFAAEAKAAGKSVLTDAEMEDAMTMQAAVRCDPVAMKYLRAGDPEVTMTWEMCGHVCKGRMDWLTYFDTDPVIVGLKTSRDCRHFQFGKQAAQLGYHLQWSYYLDGFHTITKRIPRVVEIVVESKPPHAVAVYRISNDVLDQGRDEYLEALGKLQDCERTNTWPGPYDTEQELSLPSWVYQSQDDLAEIGLEA